jgi:hypothetical protein
MKKRQEDAMYIEKIMSFDSFKEASLIDRMKLIILACLLIDSSLVKMQTVRIPLLSKVNAWIRNLSLEGKFKAIRRIAKASTEIEENSEAIGEIISCRAFMQSPWSIQIALMIVVALNVIQQEGGKKTSVIKYRLITYQDEVTLGTLSGLATRLTTPEKIGLIADIAVIAMSKTPEKLKVGK